MTSLDTIYKGLRRYVRKEVLDGCVSLMRKLDMSEDLITQRQAAQLIYLSCAIAERERTRAALKMDRTSTSEYREVNMIEALLLHPDGKNESSVNSNVLRDLSRQYRGVQTPGYIDGKPIQVRGGSSRNWTTHAKHYVRR
jgi:hypothetical protein